MQPAASSDGAASATLEASGSPTEKAILLFGSGAAGGDYPAIKAAFEVLQVEPFSSERKRMGVGVRERATGVSRVLWKGASEMLLTRCARVLRADGSSAPLDDAAAAGIRAASSGGGTNPVLKHLTRKSIIT